MRGESQAINDFFIPNAQFFLTTRSPRGPALDLSASSASAERTAVYVPSATELEQTASLLVSLQEEIARLNREKAAIGLLVMVAPITLESTKTAEYREVTKLKEALKAREDENQALGE
jgi:hypothetical protein